LNTHTVEFIQGLLLAFACMVILMPPYLRLLRWIGIGKQIREDGPGTHLVKQGTPTMGGVLIVFVILAVAFVFDAFDTSTYSPLAVLALVGGLGAVDDWLNARTGIGIRVRQKLVWQSVVAIGAAIYIQNHFGFNGFRVPFVGDVINTSTLWLPFINHNVEIGSLIFIAVAVVAIVGASNGVNLTDGLDGLAGGTLIFAFVPFLIIALLNDPAQPNLAILCSLLIGALLGFLWFNVHPAQVFMGDAGSLSLGATLAVVSLITGQILILPLIGVIFVVEAGSVVLQVAFFKVTGGRRIFRMSPLHHHFELGGWPETKISLRFWIVGALAGLLGVTLFLATLQRLE
jgi:phospho-N-acetylmuramoyl-pentapeptide-transferase